MFALAARELEDSPSKDKAATVIKGFLAKLRERLPTAAEFAAAFAEVQFTEENAKQRSLVRYLLSRIDRYQRKHGAVDYDKMSIEHIAPVSPGGGSAALPNVGKVGNLILAPESLNAEVLGNKPFGKKKTAYKKAHLPLDELLTSASPWGEADIEARTAALATFVQDKVFRV